MRRSECEAADRDPRSTQTASSLQPFIHRNANMDLDPTFIIPAIIFTVVAVYFASSLLSKKPDAPSSSAGNKKPKVGYGDDIPPSRALGEPRRAEPGPAAAAVEDVGAAEKLQDVPVAQVKVGSIGLIDWSLK